MSTNTIRHAALMQTIRETRVDNLPAYAGEATLDDIYDMQNRHHAIWSAVTNYIEADIAAFNAASHADIDGKRIGEILDATFKEEIADRYFEARQWLRGEKPVDLRSEHRIGSFEAGVRRAA